MVRRLLRAGHECVVYDLNAAAVQELAQAGAVASVDFADFVARLRTPRAVWLMVPAAVVDRTIGSLKRLLAAEDVIIDGGNSHYRDDLRRFEELRRSGVHYVDAGTSGGVWGLENGYCLMVGGDRGPVSRLEPIFQALAPTPAGYLHCGPSGAGHFVKMVHNGIEYGLMAAYAEGFNLLRHANAGEEHRSHDAETAPLAHPEAFRYDFDVAAIAKLWGEGSVIRSWLLDLTARALGRDPELEAFRGHVSDSGEGRWTIEAAIETAVPVPVLSAALFARFASRGEADFADKLLSAMRSEFGGHGEKPPTPDT
jgi:6-phosphogluconate dehydrogenase